jgi:hypothetical protein
VLITAPNFGDRPKRLQRHQRLQRRWLNKHG